MLLGTHSELGTLCPHSPGGPHVQRTLTDISLKEGCVHIHFDSCFISLYGVLWTLSCTLE